VVDHAPERPAEGEQLPVALLEPALRGDLDPDRAPVDAAAAPAGGSAGSIGSVDQERPANPAEVDEKGLPK
jgi:hypothetical protein